MFSSGPAMTASRVPTGDASPSFASRFRSTPSPRATSSITALSVSTSARTSPDFIWSPSFFSHCTRRPSSIVGESASITTLVAIYGLAEVHDFLDGGECLRCICLRRPLEILCVWHRRVSLMHPDHRSIEIVEALALNEVDNLRAHSADLPAFLEHNRAIGFLH